MPQMLRPNQLSPGMRKALLMIGFGVSAYAAGYYSIDNPDERLDLRSADALVRRGLVFYFVSGGAPMQGKLGLTLEGETIFEELRE